MSSDGIFCVVSLCQYRQLRMCLVVCRDMSHMNTVSLYVNSHVTNVKSAFYPSHVLSSPCVTRCIIP